MHPSRLLTRCFHSSQPNEAQAVAEIAEQLDARGASGVLVFCSASYDLPKLGAALAAAFDAPVVGCTTAGQLGPGGYHTGGITALALTSPDLRMHTYLIQPLRDSEARALEIGADVIRTLHESESGSGFGLLLVDGLSLAEERLAAALYRSVGSLPFIGGSAGDDLRLERTFVYVNGEFRTDAGVFVLFETSLPFETFKIQHVEPTDVKLVVTLADPDRRIVYEMNGEPAAEAYAEALGIPLESLSSQVFSKNPLVLKFHREPHVRAIRRANSDLSLTLQCAIEEGLVVRLGRATNGPSAIARSLSEVRARVADPRVVLGCDCVLRRIELDPSARSAVGDVLAQQNVVGFSGYGEQYNAAHVNQTFTGVVLGGGQ